MVRQMMWWGAMGSRQGSKPNGGGAERLRLREPGAEGGRSNGSVRNLIQSRPTSAFARSGSGLNGRNDVVGQKATLRSAGKNLFDHLVGARKKNSGIFDHLRGC